MTDLSRTDILIMVAIIATIILGIIGWVANILQLAGMDMSTEFIIKVIGCFIFPVGAVLGWVGIF